MMSFSTPATKTTGNSRPFAAWIVIRLTRPPVFLRVQVVTARQGHARKVVEKGGVHGVGVLLEVGK